MKEYPWISFKLELNKIPWDTWFKLGECVSKCEHIRNVPLPPELQKKLHALYLGKGVMATTAIEGNTLSEEQVQQILQNKSELPPSQKYMEQEVKNIIDACNQIAVLISKENFSTISVEHICDFNRMVLHDLECEEHVIPGTLRQTNVVVGNIYRPPSYQDVPELLQKFCTLINDPMLQNSDPEKHTLFSIIKAIIAHLYIAWIHPFGDGNGRTARLLEFAILLKSGVPSTAAHLLSNHYNLTRPQYYMKLDKASKTGNIIDFISYASQGLLDGLKEELRYIMGRVLHISWKDFIYETFRKLENTDKRRRQRQVILELSENLKPHTKEEIEDKTAKHYKHKTTKTLTRDLNELIEMDLIKKHEDTYEVNVELVLSTRPFSTTG